MALLWHVQPCGGGVVIVIEWDNDIWHGEITVLLIFFEFEAEKQKKKGMPQAATPDSNPGPRKGQDI